MIDIRVSKEKKEGRGEDARKGRLVFTGEEEKKSRSKEVRRGKR